MHEQRTAFLSEYTRNGRERKADLNTFMMTWKTQAMMARFTLLCERNCGFASLHPWSLTEDDYGRTEKEHSRHSSNNTIASRGKIKSFCHSMLFFIYISFILLFCFASRRTSIGGIPSGSWTVNIRLCYWITLNALREDVGTATRVQIHCYADLIQVNFIIINVHLR